MVSNFIFKVRVETRAEKEKKKRRDILERGMKKTEEALENWNPHEDPKAESDPFRTLFVARINFDTSQSKLKREFEEFGRIRHVSIPPVFAVYFIYFTRFDWWKIQKQENLEDMLLLSMTRRGTCMVSNLRKYES